MFSFPLYCLTVTVNNVFSLCEITKIKRTKIVAAFVYANKRKTNEVKQIFVKTHSSVRTNQSTVIRKHAWAANNANKTATVRKPQVNNKMKFKFCITKKEFVLRRAKGPFLRPQTKVSKVRGHFEFQWFLIYLRTAESSWLHVK